MDTLSVVDFLVAAVAVFAGSTVLAAVGFGIGLVGMPMALLVLDSQSAVMMMNAALLPLSVLLVLENRAHIRARETLPIGIAGLGGASVGVFILSSTDESALKIGIVVLIMVFAVAAGMNIRGPIPKPHLVGPSAGFLAALMLATAGVGGPLVVLFVLTRNWQRDAVRGSLALYFLFVMTTAVVGYAIGGLYTAERTALSIMTIGPVLAAFFLGSRIARRMNERVFRAAAIVVIMVTSMVVLVRELVQLW